MPFPYIRLAQPGDYEAIWEIWMQDHVHQWMSFLNQDKETFKARYQFLDETSDIYVMIDLIEGVETVVGVRRIHYGDGLHRHIAEFCSMGIHKDYQGRGYATTFYDKFEAIVKKRGIQKIELTQSSNNKGAISIADKRLFAEESIFPDWLERTSNEGTYHIYERFIYKFVDDNFTQYAKSLPSLKLKEVFPELNNLSDVKVKRKMNLFTCSHHEKALFRMKMDPNETTYSHIGFLSFDPRPAEYSSEAVAGFKKILMNIMYEARVKKVEFFTHDPIIIQIAQQAGFYVRGEKLASRYENGCYQNELGLEYSFFDINDAKKIIFSQINDPVRKENIEKALTKCQTTINRLHSEMQCDGLGANYLENLVYQMVRDELRANKVFSLTEKNWEPLLLEAPHALCVDINELHQKLHSSSYKLFTRPAPLVEHSDECQVISSRLPSFSKII